MDRAAQLAIAAREMLAFERIGDFTPAAARNATMETMREVADELGYPGNERDAAIAAALEAATKSPVPSDAGGRGDRDAGDGPPVSPALAD